MIAYITKQGSIIEREGMRLIVTAPDMKHILFASQLEQVVIMGNITLTAPARYLLLREGIDTVFLRKDGRYLGRLLTAEPANAALRKRQFLLTDNLPFRLNVSRSIVNGKILNQATLLARIKRSRLKEEAGKAAKELQGYADMANRACNLSVLRGIEGKAAARYFECFPLGLTQDWGFKRRLRRPPPDPVNAVLSFLYTLLALRCGSALRCAGLDTQPGLMHEISYSRESLALDLMEEFRPMIADALTLSLFNMRVLDWDDFSTPAPNDSEDDDTGNTLDIRIDKAVGDPLTSMSVVREEEQENSFIAEDIVEPVEHGRQNVRPAIILSKTALRSVITAWSKKLETEFFHPLVAKQMRYLDAIQWQARMLRTVIEGGVEQYAPLMLR